MHSKKLIYFVSFFILILLNNACSQKEQTIRIAVNPWPGYSDLYLAKELKYFTQENINVELVEFLSLADSSRAFERGQVDAWCTTGVELLINQYNTNKKAVAIWATNVSNGGDMLLAHQPISKVSDLKGKKIAVEPATVDIVILMKALEQANLSMEDVSVIPMSHSLMKNALKNKTVDAVTIYPPESIQIEADKTINRIFDSKKIPDTIIDVLAVNKEQLDTNYNKWQSVINAIKKARLYAINHPDKSKKLISDHLKIADNEFQNSMAGIKMINTDKQKIYLSKNGKLDASLRIIKDIIATKEVNLDSISIESLHDDVLVK